MSTLAISSVGAPLMPADTNKDTVVAVHVENTVTASQSQQHIIQEKTIVAFKADIKAGQSDSDTATEERTETVSPADAPLRKYTMKEVATHNTVNDMWFVIDNEVFDVTSFQKDHPGGGKIFKGVAGKDATKKFDKYHRRAILGQYKSKLRIGEIGTEEATPAPRRGFLSKMGFSKG